MNEQLPSPNTPDKKARGKAKIRGLSIFPVKINGVDSWRVQTPMTDGKRWRKTFRSEKDARTFYDAQYNQLKIARVAGLGLSERQRVDALAALEILAPFGATLQEAAQAYAQSHKAVSESQTVAVAIQRLLAAKKADGMSARYLKDLRNRLDRFGLEFGERAIATITAPEIGDWLRDLPVGRLTRNTFYLRLSALFNFAVEQHWASESPVRKSMRAKVVGTEPQILTPKQFAALLIHASDETRPYWLLGGFAGLRSAELERLEWNDIDFESNLIEVNPRKSKTASHRLVPIHSTLRAWLQPYQNRTSGTVCPTSLRLKLGADRERAGITKWPSNALRHSYASYHLAAFNDAAKLALALGHSDVQLVFQHYRQRVRPALAQSWWAILPAHADNVVSLTA